MVQTPTKPDYSFSFLAGALYLPESLAIAALLRQTTEVAARASNEMLPCQLQRLAELAAVKKGGGAKGVEYVSARLIPISFDKAILESEADLAALRNAYVVELGKNKRITL